MTMKIDRPTGGRGIPYGMHAEEPGSIRYDDLPLGAWFVVADRTPSFPQMKTWCGAIHADGSGRVDRPCPDTLCRRLYAQGHLHITGGVNPVESNYCQGRGGRCDG